MFWAMYKHIYSFLFPNVIYLFPIYYFLIQATAHRLVTALVYAETQSLKIFNLHLS